VGALLRPIATTARNVRREALIMLVVSGALTWLVKGPALLGGH
jgi:hypothetical protein